MLNYFSVYGFPPLEMPRWRKAAVYFEDASILFYLVPRFAKRNFLLL
jgi:hypothetical protein